MEQKKILIVDDERNICFVLGTCLENEDYQVELAANGEVALEKVAKTQFNLVFLDMKMPGLDGLTVLKMMKEIHPFLNVIMMTAYGTIESAVEAMKLGAVDYLRKPFSPDDVRELADKIIKRQSMDLSAIEDYQSLVECAKGFIIKKEFLEAKKWLQKALSTQPTSPAAFNLLGVMLEMEDQILEAEKMYRAALALDPTYVPANENLHRAVEWDYNKEGFNLGGNSR
jgi:DNA-binding NtrC family response regulator